jgi:hypothetical protein
MIEESRNEQTDLGSSLSRRGLFKKVGYQTSLKTFANAG